MAYYPMPLPGEVPDIPAPGRGREPYKPPRVWKGVATLAAMFLLVGAVTGVGVLESNNLHSMPISSSAAAPAALAGPSHATSQSPVPPGRG
ncbi:MAG TPA: hypothetical protein VG014_06360 [Acidimicrobiales bacterium]|jgi:hypothetical protein|nr:hypothetical protein [Acidimicrobiales bacterium]